MVGSGSSYTRSSVPSAAVLICASFSDTPSDSLAPPPSPYPAHVDPSPTDSNGTESTEIDEDAQDNDAQDEHAAESPAGIVVSSPKSPENVRIVLDGCQAMAD